MTRVPKLAAVAVAIGTIAVALLVAADYRSARPDAPVTVFSDSFDKSFK